MCCLASLAFAQNTITVLRVAPPGASTAMWADAVKQTLELNGYKTNLVGLTNCQEGAKWIDTHPDDPVIVSQISDPFLLGMIQPSNPAACNMNVNTASLVAIEGKWFHFMCGHTGKGADIMSLIHSNGAKIGSWNSPIQIHITSDQMTDIGVKNFKVIGYSAGKDMLQAFASGDIDYLVLTSEVLAQSLPNATCFATSAPHKYAAQVGRVSYNDINKNTRHEGSGLWPIIVAYHTNMTPLRTMFAPGGKHSELLNKLSAPCIPVTDPISVQVQDLHNRAEEIKQ